MEVVQQIESPPTEMLRTGHPISLGCIFRMCKYYISFNSSYISAFKPLGMVLANSYEQGIVGKECKIQRNVKTFKEGCGFSFVAGLMTHFFWECFAAILSKGWRANLKPEVDLKSWVYSSFRRSGVQLLVSARGCAKHCRWSSKKQPLSPPLGSSTAAR